MCLVCRDVCERRIYECFSGETTRFLDEKDGREL